MGERSYKSSLTPVSNIHGCGRVVLVKSDVENGGLLHHECVRTVGDPGHQVNRLRRTEKGKFSSTYPVYVHTQTSVSVQIPTL